MIDRFLHRVRYGNPNKLDHILILLFGIPIASFIMVAIVLAIIAIFWVLLQIFTYITLESLLYTFIGLAFAYMVGLLGLTYIGDRRGS